MGHEKTPGRRGGARRIAAIPIITFALAGVAPASAAERDAPNGSGIVKRGDQQDQNELAEAIKSRLERILKRLHRNQPPPPGSGLLPRP